MNCSTGTQPSSESFQRASASAPDHAPRRQVHLRLVVHRERAAMERVAQPRLQVQAFDRLHGQCCEMKNWMLLRPAFLGRCTSRYRRF